MKLQSNKISFKGQNIYVGIDVHLKTWSVTIVSVSTIAYCSPNNKCVSLHLKYKDERYV